jgi:hypothetical protein
MGETRVDLLHLLEDLRDAYPGSTEETILIEIVANSLDSGATRVGIATDPGLATLTLVDNGAGMRRRELARYHDVATSTKVRGAGIGFAGVGIKIALLVYREVLTETQRGRGHVATVWHLASRHRASWRWVPPPGLVSSRGTAVRLTLENPLSPLLDSGFVEAALRRHFEPLFESDVKSFLTSIYPRGLGLELNGRPLEPEPERIAERAALTVRLVRRRKASAVGFVIRDSALLPEERRGLAVSTRGKVIKRGWDWLGLAPAAAERIGGLIEVPALAECLTLSKADFIRAGSRGALYLAYRKAIQEAMRQQLAAWGDAADAGEPGQRRAARPVERDLQGVLSDLADHFPLLAMLVERRLDGQRRLPTGSPAESLEAGALTARVGSSESTQGSGPGAGGQPPPAVAVESTPAESRVVALATARVPTGSTARRPGRYALSIRFEQRPDDPEPARLVESTVWVNDAHPAYRRAVASRSEGYHLALSVAMALAPLVVEPANERAFLTAFLARWGEAATRRRRSS